MPKKPSYEELEQRVQELELEAKKHRRFEKWYTSNAIAEDIASLSFETIFDLEELQLIQDQFSSATGVSSIITTPDGDPVTRPSNFCELCTLIRNTKKGKSMCLASEADFRRYNPDEPMISFCHNVGLMEAGVSITIGDKFIGNWLIGQVRKDDHPEDSIRDFAREIEMDEDYLVAAFCKVPIMSISQFRAIAKLLFSLVNQLSEAKYKNYQQNKLLREHKATKGRILSNTEELTSIIVMIPFPISIHAEDGESIFINRAWQETSGYSLDDVPTVKDWIRKAHVDDPETITRVNRTAYDLKEQSYRGEYVITAKNGKKLIWEYTAAPLGKTPDGRRMVMTVAADITHRKQMENELIKNEKKYRSYIDNSPVAIFFVNNKNASIYDANTAACKLVGYSHSELVSMSIFDIDQSPDDPASCNIVNSMLKKTKHFRGERKLKHKDGYFIDIDLEAVMLDENISMGFFIDITERKRMEELIIKNTEDVHRLNEKFSLAANCAKIGVWEFHPQDNTLLWDDNMFKLFNVKVKDFTKTYESWRKIVHPDDIEATEADLQSSLESGNNFESEFRIIWQNGETRHIKGFAKLEKDENGAPLRMTGLNYDITKQKLLEEEVRNQRNFLQYILNSVPLAISWKDMNGVYLGGNNKFAEISGLNSTNDIPGKTDFDFFWGAKYGRSIVQKDKQVLQSKQISLNNVYQTVKGNQPLWIESSSIPLSDTEDNVYGILCVSEDITERKKNEETLQDALKTAKDANRSKSEFLATMSHEIRTPLNGIIGFSGVLSEELPLGFLPNSENIKEYLDTINQCGETLLGIINDVLLLSSIEAGQFNMISEEFSPSETLRAGIASFRFKANQKNIELILTRKNLPDKIIGDNLRLKQILFNIIGNAIKFTERGSIEIDAEYKDEKLILAVTDTGIGIPADKINKILNPFYQADQSSTRQQGGAGLGLAIVSRILENLGGTINITSKVNHGTRIIIHFPVTPIASDLSNTSAVSREVEKNTSTKTNILIIEDDPVNVKYLSKIFKGTDYIFNIAESFGQMKKICENGVTPEIALIDIALPDADGFECLNWLKNRYPGCNIKYIVQTAHVLSDKTPLYEEAGFDAFIGKPYKKSELLEIIARYT